MRWRPFEPHRLFPGGYLQTLAGNLEGAAEAPPHEVMPLLLEDGDSLLLRVDLPPAGQRPVATLLLLHGIVGCSESSYNLRLSRKLGGLGYRVVRFNHRGCGPGAEGLARQIYHSGASPDVLAGIQAVAARWPGEPLGVVGFSLSGNALLALLGREPGLARALPPLKAAAAVCPPVDLERCSRSMSAARNKLFDQYFARKLVRAARRRSALFPDLPAPLPRFPRGLSIRQFDELYTAPQAGFRDRADYYSRSSSGPLLRRVEVPTLILAAKDDPIVPWSSFEGHRLSSAIDLRAEEGGGHMGFLSRSRTRFGDYRWMDEAIVSWAEAMVGP